MRGGVEKLDPSLPLGERVYLAMRADLMAGRFAPAERLGDGRLAERYGVSRTPAREALARLVADGLVQRADDGLYPYRPRFEEITALYELRSTLELRGIERGQVTPTARHDHDVLGVELDRWTALRGDPPEPDAGFVDSDERFHTALLASSGNPALVDALRSVNTKIRPVRMFDYLTPDRMAATITEHIDITQLVLDGRLGDAYTALKAHIDESRKIVVARAEQAMTLARMASVLRP